MRQSTDAKVTQNYRAADLDDVFQFDDHYSELDIVAKLATGKYTILRCHMSAQGQKQNRIVKSAGVSSRLKRTST